MAVLPTAYALVLAWCGKLQALDVALAALCLALSFSGPRPRRLLKEAIPYLIFLYGFDLVRFGRDMWLTRERVTTCGMRDVEIALLGFGSGRTPGEWLAQFRSPLLDLLCAIPYFVFVYVVIVYAAYLYRMDRPRMRLYLWSFALANTIAYLVWLAFPVAPPWYVHAHGCAVDLSVAPSAAGLVRVDEWLNIRYFRTFYGNSSYVFGAMPSLHCAYPMIGLLTAWPAGGWRTRPLHLGYVAVMFVASVYLDHHYVLDGLAGWTLAWLSVVVMRRTMSYVLARWPSHDDSPKLPAESHG